MVLILTLLPTSAFASSNQIAARFSHLTSSDGLAYNAVTAIAQDDLGFMWFGTRNGLSRFDGYQFKNFILQPDGNGLSGAVVRSLLIDEQGIIWIGLDKNGLNRFDPSLNRFQSDFATGQTIVAMADNGDGKIWLGTDSGLQLFDTTTFEVETIIDNVYVRALALNQNKLYVGTQTGLLVYDVSLAQSEVIHFPNHLKPAARSILLLSDGLLLATTEGLFHYHFDGQKVIPIVRGLKAPFRFLSLTQDHTGAIWLGSTQHGIYRLLRSPSGQFEVHQHFQRDRSFSHSLAGNTVLSLAVDNEGNLWVGSFNGGVSRVNLSSFDFGMYNNSLASLSCLPSAVIYSMFKQADGTLWLGTQEGLVIVKAGLCEVFQAQGHLGSLPHQNLKVIFEDSRGDMWIGTASGLAIFDKQQRSFLLQSGALSRSNITFIVEDLQQGILVGTTNGLFYRPFGQVQFTAVSTEQALVGYRRYHTAFKAENGRIWLATAQGLAYFEFVGKPLVKTWLDDNAQPMLTNLRVLNGIGDFLWLGDRASNLRRVNLHNNTVTSAAFGSAQLSIALEHLIFDQQHRMWLSTSHGLLVGEFYEQTSKRLDFSSIAQWRRFSQADGLQGDNFLTRSAFVSADGELFFGGREGFNRFYPQQVLDLAAKVSPPKATITAFSLFNQQVTVNQALKDSDFELIQAIEYTDKIELSHRDYVFGFEFSALSFTDPARNRYAYQLIGFDKDWLEVGANQRFASYSNLAPGDYWFRLRASNKDGVWQELARQIKVSVAAAPWATPWAYAFYLLLIFFAIFSFMTWRTRSLKTQALLLQHKVSERTWQLQQEKQRVELLLEQKHDEFANVSHEFRTPLTLVLGPVSQLLSSSLPEHSLAKLQIVKRNGFRLLRMVDQLLHMEKFRVQSIDRPCEVELSPMINLLAQSFADLAHEQQVDLRIEPIAEVYISFTSDGFEKVILNLLSNALKYTQAGGSIIIGAEYLADSQMVNIRVKDSGIGIAKEHLVDIFERFHRVLDKRSEQVTGAGIGLALVQQLVVANQGEITVRSELGVGSEFVVTLPCYLQATDMSELHGANQQMIELELESLQGQRSDELEYLVVEGGDGAVIDEGRASVLIVEDNPDMRHYIIQSLAQTFTVSAACDGASGFELAKNLVPDIIVSDVMMPVMDGYQFTQAIKEEQTTSHIPVVLLTARDDKQSRLKGWHQKADEYLTKPFDAQELIIRLNNLLAIRDILRQRFNQTIFQQVVDVPPVNVCVEPNHQDAAINEAEQAKLAAQRLFLTKIDDILSQVYTEQSTTVPQIAKLAAMSERQLFRKLKATVDMNPTEYLRRYRLRKACELLKQGMNSSRVALEVGFSSHSYFSRCFGAQYGCAPSVYGST